MSKIYTGTRYRPNLARRLGLQLPVVAIGALAMILAGSISRQSHASGNYIQQKILVGNSFRQNSKMRVKISRYGSPRRLVWSPKAPSAKVINVARALIKKKSAGRRRQGLKITIHSNSPANRNPATELSHRFIRYGYGLAVPDFSDINCRPDYDCTFRLGNSASSPKIIVIGRNRAAPISGTGSTSRPKIIHPPS